MLLPGIFNLTVGILDHHGNKIQNSDITQRDLRSVNYGYQIQTIILNNNFLKKFSNVDFDAKKWNCRLPVDGRNVRKEIIRNQECYGAIFSLIHRCWWPKTNYVGDTDWNVGDWSHSGISWCWWQIATSSTHRKCHRHTSFVTNTSIWSPTLSHQHHLTWLI